MSVDRLAVDLVHLALSVHRLDAGSRIQLAGAVADAIERLDDNGAYGQGVGPGRPPAGLRDFCEAEASWQVNKALDDHVYAKIVAASPPFGTSGTTLIEKVRNGIATMRSTGANPKILVLNPSDAASLDLATDAGGFVFPSSATGTSSPLWGLQVVERAGAGNEPPYLIDPVMLGQLYVGVLRWEANPYTEFNKNLTTVRMEMSALFHVRNASGARRIAAS